MILKCLGYIKSYCSDISIPLLHFTNSDNYKKTRLTTTWTSGRLWTSDSIRQGGNSLGDAAAFIDSKSLQKRTDGSAAYPQHPILIIKPALSFQE